MKKNIVHPEQSASMEAIAFALFITLQNTSCEGQVDRFLQGQTWKYLNSQLG